MRQTLPALAAFALAMPAAAQVVVIPILAPGTPLGSLTASISSALPPPLTSSAPLPVDITVLGNGVGGSGIANVLTLNGGPVVGSALNNVIGTPLLGLPSGTAQPVDVAVLGGDGVGNSNADGLAGVAALSGSNVANGGLIGLGLINRDNTGNGQALGVAVLSGSNSGNSSQGLGVGLLNRGDVLHVSAAGNQVSLSGLVQQGQGALPGLDQGGVAVGGGLPVTSSNPLLNLGVAAGNNAGSGGLIGVAALSGQNAANAQLLGVGVANQSGSANAPVGVDLLGGSGSGVSSNGAGVAVLSGNNSGNGGAIGAGVLTGQQSGQGGTLGAGVLSGANSGKSDTIGTGVLSGPNSGSGGVLGGNIAGGGSSNGSGTGGNGGQGGSGIGGNGSTISAAGGYYSGDNIAAGRLSDANSRDLCTTGYRDNQGRWVKPAQCSPVKTVAAAQ